MNNTIKEVAAKANVSIATVSRVINHSGGYSEKTRIKVQKAIDELEYQPNSIARGLVKKNSKSIGIILPKFPTDFHAAITDGIEDEARKNGFITLLSHTVENEEPLAEALQVFTERKVDGIIFISYSMVKKEFAYLSSLKLPYIFISTFSEEMDYPYIKVDDYQAAYDAVIFLHKKKGYQKIALIGGNPDDLITGYMRILGYRDALKSLGLSMNEKIMKYASFDYEDGIRCMEELLLSKEDFDCVFALSDELAMGAMNLAQYLGYKIPQDFGIMGFDDSRTALRTLPQLTTVHQPLYEMGVLAFSKIMNKLQKDKKIETEIVNFSIIQRGSTSKTKME